jgi:hypothetical protein
MHNVVKYFIVAFFVLTAVVVITFTWDGFCLKHYTVLIVSALNV